MTDPPQPQSVLFGFVKYNNPIANREQTVYTAVFAIAKGGPAAAGLAFVAGPPIPGHKEQDP